MPTIVSATTLPSLSIRTKLLLLVASVVLIPGAVYGLVAVVSSRAALARATGLQLVGEAQNAADRLATALRSERDALTSAAHQDVMREIRIGDLDKRISSFLASLQRGCAACVDLMALDGRGRVVAASQPALIGRVTEAPTGAALIEGPFDDPEYGRPTLRLTAPIADPEAPATALGTLVALLDWERVTAITERTRTNLGRAGIDADVLVLDEHATVVGGAARPAGQWQRGDTVRLTVWSGPESAPAAGVDNAAGVLLGRVRLPDDLPAWTVLVAEPLSEAFAPVRRMAGILGGALGLTLVLALAAALAAARRATRPLAELTAAALEVGRGAPVPTVTVRTGDEIGALAAAFNRMASDLGRAERRLADAAKFAFVGELAAGVAHEVRTPLGVLRSATQLLERTLHAPDEESRELLHMLRDEVDRIERVVSGLLELGRPRELRLESAPLGQILWRAADLVGVQARERAITIVRHPCDPDPRVTCDPELIYQLVLNLLVNAVQILPAGGRVELALLPPHDGGAAFEVRDDGPGIPADLRASLFQPFATRREGGIGLGLTFVQRVVLEHHGRLTVTDGPTGGTVFRIELALAEDTP